MTLDSAWTAAGVALTAFIAWTTLVGWVWSIRGIAVNARDDLAALIAEREKDKVTWGIRLTAAEQTAGAVRELTAAVRHGGEMTTQQISALTERFTEHAAETKEQLAELRAEQRRLRDMPKGAQQSRRNP